MKHSLRRGFLNAAILLIATVGVFGLLLRRTTGGVGEFKLVFMRPVANLYFVVAVIVLAAFALAVVLWMRHRRV